MFESPIGVLTSDRFSLLAAVCRSALFPTAQQGPVVDADGTYFLDRDWWLFRHVLAFLREGVLPDAVDLLQQLYAESAFYRLTTLRNAIEDRCGHWYWWE